MSEPIDCPALHHRDRHYPYGRFMPMEVRMLRTATAKVPLSNDWRTVEGGKTYPSWTNSRGAVSVVMPDGKRVPVMPREFEVVEWWEVGNG